MLESKVVKGGYIGEYSRVNKGDTWDLDYSSNRAV